MSDCLCGECALCRGETVRTALAYDSRPALTFDLATAPSVTALTGKTGNPVGFYWPASDDMGGDIEIAEMVGRAWLARD